jgi:subtilisin family serine protease
MPNDYIVAYDDIFRAGDGSGTSFAAPRVAGAAAIVRHKFPSLNGPKLKQVLLKSADDLGAPGPDAVFGHGQLNLINALLPIDGLTR